MEIEIRKEDRLLKALKNLLLPNSLYSACAQLLLYFLFPVLLFIAKTVQAQCNTTLNKLLPESSVNNDDRFGSAIAANGQYMVVAAENSDTLGIYYGGAAYVYEKTVAGWAYRAMLTPSHEDEYDFFGNKVAIDQSGNTIVIINRNYTKGSAYIFEKPVGGWQTMHETANIKFPEYLEFNSALDISDDGSTIVVSNPMSPNGMLYLLRKPISGWTSSMIPETLAARTGNSGIWLGNDVLIQGDYIYASANNEGNPAIHVYKKNGADYALIAKLTTALPGFYFGYNLTVNNNTLAATGISSEPGDVYSESYFIFVKNGEWTNANETVKFQVPQLSSYKYPYPIQFTSPTQLVTGVFVKDGSYYTGKILEITTGNGTWQDISVATVFEEHELSTPPEFANDVVWNGSDLVMTSVRKQIGYSFRNSALSLTKSNGLWGSVQKVALPRNSSSNVYFGTSIVKTPDAMLAGAPYDGTVGRGAGAIYIYNRVGTDFTKVNTIFPSPRKIRSTGGSDAGFGSAVSVNGDELAVGAPSFLYAPNSYGKIFLYRRTNKNWTSSVLYDSLTVPENLKLNHVGTEVVMNDRVLFASAYNNFNDEHTNAVVVFEKINGKWSYKQLIKLGRPLDKSWPSVKFSLHDSQLAVGEFFTIDGGVSIMNKNPTTGSWEVTAFIPGEIFSGLGSSVKLLDNHLFVGAPGLSYNNVYRSGAVAVFTKLPGESWRSDMQASALIGAKVPVEGAFFGSSVDVIGNTLAVGAPGMFLTYDSKVRTIPGNSYIIQSSDYYWKNTIQYLNLQGDRYASNERDHFGSFVTLDEEYFYVGARSENTATGKFSGAVYYIPTPPLIFLQPPVCKNAEPLVLRGYPFNGTWTGPGVDASLGTFNPSLAGEGFITLKYSTPNCSYQGTVQIEVKAPVTVKQISPAQVIICSQEHTTLQLESVDGASYNWYYKQEGADSFVWLTKGGASLVATNTGDYKAIISSQCSAESPVFSVRLESLTLIIGPQRVACSTDQSVSLVAIPNTGTWEGTGVTSNQFNPAGLSNGVYKLTYRLTTPKGCKIALKDSIKLNVVQPITINQIDNDFCETGSAIVQATPPDNTLTYTWNYKETENASLLPIDKILTSSAIVYKQGYYQASATNGECSALSNVVKVGFGNLSYSLLPAENSQNQVCAADDFSVSVEAREGTKYTWQFKAGDGDTFQTMDGETSDRLVVRENGFYRVQGKYGFCSFESSPVSVEFLRDKTFVPNVFTPNGDEKNPVFKVETNSQISLFTIFNRYGEEIHNNPAGDWDGGEAPAGIYFWHLKYNACDSQKELKGWVHLLR